jgi:hypothetical protein
MDVDTIELGVDSTKVIDKAVDEVDILLCIIGKRKDVMNNPGCMMTPRMKY